MTLLESTNWSVSTGKVCALKIKGASGAVGDFLSCFKFQAVSDTSTRLRKGRSREQLFIHIEPEQQS